MLKKKVMLSSSTNVEPVDEAVLFLSSFTFNRYDVEGGSFYARKQIM